MSGRWNQPDVPHRGWTCKGVCDLGEPPDAPRSTCEMCQKEEIRYVHSMRHPDHERELNVGCIGAGNMCEGYDSTREERLLRNRAARRRAWTQRRWRELAKGEQTLTVDAVTFVVRTVQGGWHGRVLLADGRWRPGRRTWDDLDGLKRAMFDYVFPASTTLR